MNRQTLPSGVTVELPEGAKLPSQPSESVPRRRGAAAAPAAVPVRDSLVDALRSHDLSLVGDAPILLPAVVGATPAAAPAATTARRGPAPAPAAPAQASIDVPLAAGEHAVLLVERNGFYEWHVAPAIDSAPVPSPAPPRPTGPVRRGGSPRSTAPAAPTRRARFTVPLPPPSSPPSAPPTAAGRPARRGAITDAIVGAAVDWLKAYVLKFAAATTATALMKFLERNLKRGLVHLTTTRPEEWRSVEDLTEALPPLDRRPRILLLIHGTFSSTVGTYGGLGATPWGQAFLNGALAGYDAVVGFNHSTLSEDPRQNANDLWRRLRIDAYPLPPIFDVVAFSRGGLVFRYLAEELLPRLTPAPKIDRAVFVGCTLSGTELANPENWDQLLGLYTNLAAAAARALGKLPSAGAKTVSAVLDGSVQTLGDFAKFLVSAAVTERKIPGLSAMEPKGDFVRQINRAQPGEPTALTSWYAAVTTEFEPRSLLKLIDDGRPSELPRELVLRLADGVADRLFGQANDLVVHTPSMTSLDPHQGNLFKDRVEFGRSPYVYHLNYFLQPQTVGALSRWLRLAVPPPAPATGPRRRGPAFSPASVAAGVHPPLELPAAVDPNILDMPRDTTVGEAAALIRESVPSFVVLHKLHLGELLSYALPAEEILDFVREKSPAPTHQLVQSLGLHEDHASGKAPAGAEPAPRELVSGKPPTTARSVVFDGARPVGVVPERPAAHSLADLIDLSAIASRPRTDEDRILCRRIVPEPARRTTALPVSLELAPTKDASSGEGGPRRRGSRSAPPPRRRPPAVPVAAPATVACLFRAETNDEVELAKEGSVLVTVSREKLEEELRRAGSEGRAEVDPTRKITLQFIAKRNVRPAAGTQTELDVEPPDADAPVLRRFRFVPLELGEGEIWILAWQRQQPLVTLPVKFRIVPAGTPPSPRRAHVEAAGAEPPSTAKPVDRLMIIEESAGDRITYRYELNSPTLGRNWLLRSEAFKRDRADYVRRLYEKIEALWPKNGNLDLFEQELQVFGAELADQLMPKELQDVLWEHREKLPSIQVLSEEPFIPWEVLHLKPSGGTLPPGRSWFLGELGLVRWLHNKRLSPEQLWVRPHRARYLIPEYGHARYVLPQAQEEKPFLIGQFKAVECPSDPAEVNRLLRGPAAFDLLHFAGHGEADQADIDGASILLSAEPQPQDPTGPADCDHLRAPVVRQTANLTDGDGNRPLVVFNACQAGRVGWSLTRLGGFAEAFLQGGAGLFVGAHWSVGDAPARHFTEEFYRSLLAGKTVAEATVRARQFARKEQDATWLAYTVYGHPHARLVLVK
ncbi:MAG: CHAT domain-containing protein [Planctomycetes bacterium]|nr:CHAT domain-containing protein [Planctomycetota bacterium]